MDPNETLARIRVLTSDARLSYAGSKWAEQYGEELAELIKSLDDWLSKGGFKPNAWEGPFAEEPVQPDFTDSRWQFFGTDGYDVTASPYAAEDAVEAVLWRDGGDSPAEVWKRGSSNVTESHTLSPWIRQDV